VAALLLFSWAYFLSAFAEICGAKFPENSGTRKIPEQLVHGGSFLTKIQADAVLERRYGPQVFLPFVIPVRNFRAEVFENLPKSEKL
jgi:hypothetical protein